MNSSALLILPALLLSMAASARANDGLPTTERVFCSIPRAYYANRLGAVTIERAPGSPTYTLSLTPPEDVNGIEPEWQKPEYAPWIGVLSDDLVPFEIGRGRGLDLRGTNLKNGEPFRFYVPAPRGCTTLPCNPGSSIFEAASGDRKITVRTSCVSE